MSTPAPADRTLFITMPVDDVGRTSAFFEALGFNFDPDFSEPGSTACMRMNEGTFIMFGTHAKYAEFTKLPAADPRTHSIGLYCFGVGSREEVDTIMEAAVAAGAVDHDDAQDHGFMYTRSFFDLDGHGWQVMWMDPAAA